ncbi:hypothetical protein [Nocardioides daphniae]|uniref:Copper resistance protein D domain-containing protein n=1 Tax=Nocardioides daphniae TaxID=402297 RepID=A0ABQ1QLD4_9ACTN|nr:hypothetical protein [Nocardioides daphniae]GGD28893.1 hypothetical protein GCM10007231_30500 [Nocardioides daphniae]
MPVTDQSAAASVAQEREVLASTLHALAAVSLWAFLGPLWARVRRGSGPLAVVAVVGGVMIGATMLFSSGVSLVAMTAAEFGDAGAARFLVVAGWETARVAVAPGLVMVGATALAGLRHRVLHPGVTASVASSCSCWPGAWSPGRRPASWGCSSPCGSWSSQSPWLSGVDASRAES